MKPEIIASGLVEKDGKFLLMKDTLEDGKDYWIVPGGHVEFGETIETAVKSELKEETGLDISELNFLGFKEAIHTRHNYHTVIFFFLAKTSGENIVLGKEGSDARFFTREEMSGIDLVPSAKWLLENHLS